MLDRQKIVIPLAQGVDTKTDPKQVTAGKLLELENGVFTSVQAIQKRSGHVALPTQVAAQTSGITAGKALSSYNNELLLADGQSLYSYDESASEWINKGTFQSPIVTKFSVVRNTTSQSHQDGATHFSGMQLYAWEDSSGGVRYAVVDGDTGQIVVASSLLSSTGIKPRVLVLNNTFLIYFYDVSATTLKVASLPVTTPLATPSVSTLTGTAADDNAVNSTSPNYDAAIIGQNIGVVFNNGTTSGATTVRLYNGNSPTTQLYPQYVLAYRCRSVTIFPATTPGGSIGPVVAFSTDNNTSPYTSSSRYSALLSNLSAEISGGVMFTNGGPVQNRLITGVQTSTTGVGFEIYVAGTNAINQIKFDSSYSQVFDPSWQTGVLPFARAFAVNGMAYVPLVYYPGGISAFQKTYFVSSSDKQYVAKALYGTAGIPPEQYTSGGFVTNNWVMPMVANVSQISDTVFRMACLEQANLIGNGLTTATGVSTLTVDFADAQHSFADASLGGSIVFSGGIPQMYDGIGVVEDGFLIYPEAGRISASAQGSGGNLSAGSYTYSVCYEWIDHQNRVHRSRPSEGVQVTTVANDKVQLTIPYLNITNKRGDRPVQVIVYRTLVDKTILHRVTSLTAPNLNNVGVLLFQVFDTLADVQAAQYPLLYDQFLQQDSAGIPAELPNDPPPPTDIIRLHRNRLWCVDSTNPLQLWYSKECQVDAPVEFTDANVKQVDPRGGPVTALASLDDKLLVFKQDHIFIVLGQGPDNTGQNNDLSDTILVTTDAGCIDPRSIVTTPVGVMFKSRKGIYLIDRSLAMQYIGAPVEAYNSDTITSAVLVAKTNQVRFTLEGGRALIYDYFVQQWGTFTNLYAVDSIIWLGSMTLVRSSGQVLVETSGVYTDAGSPIKLKLTTAWLSFANIQGFQRVRRAQILGAWKSPHNLLVSVAVNFNDNIVQQATITPTTPTAFGGSSPYGSEAVFGGTFQLYQWRLDLAQQKTQAVRFTIEDLPAATAGEGLSLSSLGFEVGAKVGLNKMPASQIVS